MTLLFMNVFFFEVTSFLHTKATSLNLFGSVVPIAVVVNRSLM